MQTEQYDPSNDPSNIKYWINLADKYKNTPEQEEQEQKKQEPSDVIKSIIEKARLCNDNFITDKSRWKYLPDEKKMELCTHKSGISGLKKMVDGQVSKVPMYCNLCPECYKTNTDKIEKRVTGVVKAARENLPGGQWRKKVVNEDTETDSLKKHIKRNQDGRYFEIASSENGKVEVWSYVEDETGKDMSKVYGEVSNPETINFEEVYKINRKTRKKVSMGKPFRQSAQNVLESEKKDTERVLVPQVMIKDKSKQDKAELIFERTNYVREAENSHDVHSFFLLQFKYIMRELERANIEVSSVKYTYVHMSEEEMLDAWNGNVSYWKWLSENPSLSFGDEDFMDNETEYLIFPSNKEEKDQIQ